MSENYFKDFLIERLSSGNGDEKENNRVEKEFETAVTKGLRPCQSGFPPTLLTIDHPHRPNM